MQINEKSVWQLCLEIAVDMEVLSSLPTTTRAKAEKIKAHLDAYLEAATPPDVAGLVEKLEKHAEDQIDENLDYIRQADELMRQAATALRLSAGGGVPEGWKLVPVEPTPEMIGAFWRQKNCGTQEIGERGPQTDDYSAYRAMLAASPTVEAGHVE